jgi:peptidoglycan hydrolase-like protein with peptidoglycan-binding domain
MLRYSFGFMRLLRHAFVFTSLSVLPLSLIGSDTAAAKKKTAKKTTSTRSRSSRQAQPTPQRYREIQQALVNKGYLKSDPNGTWGPESVEALRRFQHDQKLNESGKVDSLSLIALGLGPKHDIP